MLYLILLLIIISFFALIYFGKNIEYYGDIYAREDDNQYPNNLTKNTRSYRTNIDHQHAIFDGTGKFVRIQDEKPENTMNQRCVLFTCPYDDRFNKDTICWTCVDNLDYPLTYWFLSHNYR